jgi:hypothetical protein
MAKKIPFKCDKCNHRGHDGNCGVLKYTNRQYSLSGITSQNYYCNCVVWLKDE